MLILDYVTLSAKHLAKRKFRTFLTALGLSIGMFLITIMLGLSFGVKQKVKEMFDFEELAQMARVVYVSPHIASVENESEDKDLIREVVDGQYADFMQGIPPAMMQEIKDMPHVNEVLRSMNVNVRSVRLPGSDKSLMANNAQGVEISPDFRRKVEFGRSLQKGDRKHVVIPGIYVRTFGIKDPAGLIGKTVMLSVTRDHVQIEPTPLNPNDFSSEWALRQAEERQRREIDEKMRTTPPPAQDFEAEIVGIVGSKGRGGEAMMIPWDWAKELRLWSRYGQDPHGDIAREGNHNLMLVVDDIDNVEEVVDDIQALGLGVESMKRDMEDMYSGMAGMAAGFGIFALVALLVAGIGVVNVMIMAIYERTREIGIMKATGASRYQVKRLFMVESGLLGLLGGAVGMLSARGLVALFVFLYTRYAIDPEDLLEGDPFILEGELDIFQFPFIVYVIVLTFSFLFGIFVGLYPAKRAAKMDPVEALRYE